MKLGIFLTQKCNLKCKHCLNQCPKNQEIPLKKYKFLLDLFKKDLKAVNFMGGEIFLHSKFREIIDETIKRKLKFSFVSNGYDYKKYKFLLGKEYEEYFVNITFSLDGLEKSHDFIRKKGSFKKVIEAIDFFTKVKKTLVTANVTMHKYNYEEFEEIIELLIKYDLDKIGIGSVISNGVNNHLILNLEQRKKIYYKTKKLDKKYKIRIKPTTSLYNDSVIRLCDRFFKYKKLYFDHDGNLIFCCNLKLPDSNILKVDYNTTKKEIYNTVANYIGKTRTFWLSKLIYKRVESYELNSCEFCSRNFKDIKNM